MGLDNVHICIYDYQITIKSVISFKILYKQNKNFHSKNIIF